jgi:hypothetical protein
MHTLDDPGDPGGGLGCQLHNTPKVGEAQVPVRLF